jgi:hypothetical protein
METPNPITKEEGIERMRMLYAMFTGVPEERTDLDTYFDLKMRSPRSVNRMSKENWAHQCGTTACLGGWASLYPPFQAMGLNPDCFFEPSYRGLSRYAALGAFFALPGFETIGIFATRAGVASEYTPELRNLSDKMIALRRIRLHLLNKGAITQVRSDELAEMEASQ